MQNEGTPQANQPTSQRPSRFCALLRRLPRVLAALIVLAVVAAAAAKYAIAPHIVRSRLTDQLAEYWSGPIEVGAVEVNLRKGLAIARDVRFCDHTGRPWASVERLTATVTEWPAWNHPVLTHLALSGVDVQLFVEAGRVHAPINWKFPDRPSKYVDLRLVSAERLRVSRIGEDGTRVTHNLAAVFRKDGRAYRLTVADTDVEAVQLRATIRQHNGPRGAGIDVDAKLTSALAAGDLRARIKLQGDRTVTQMFTRLAAFDGHIEASATLISRSDRPLKSYAAISAQQIDLSAVATALGSQQRLTGTLASGKMVVWGTGKSLEGLTAKGLVFLDDVEIHHLPVIQKIHSAVNPDEPLAGGPSDVQAIFTINWPVLTVEAAQVGDPVMATSIEPGGTVHLTTRQLDMTLASVFVPDARHVLEALPVISWAIALTKELTRLHMTGTWDEPVVEPAPLADLARGTPGLLRLMTQSGGQLGGGMLSPLQAIFKQISEAHKASSLDADGPAIAPPWDEDD